MSMSVPIKLATPTYSVKFRKESLRNRSRPAEKVAGRVPRVTRLLALAHRIDKRIRSGELKDWAEAARLIGITRARMTQIANLVLLSPELQEAILILPPCFRERELVTEHQVRGIVVQTEWIPQRSRWVALASCLSPPRQ